MVLGGRSAAAFLAGCVVGLWLTRWLTTPPDVSKEPLRTLPKHLRPPSYAAPPPPQAHHPRSASAVNAASAVNTSSILLGGIGPFDLDSRSGLRAAVAARAVRGEIATFTSNVLGLTAAANMALQLRRHGILQHMVLADARETCDVGASRWSWLGCGWSAGLPGFEAKYSAGVGGSTTHLWSLWSAKWLLVARLTELRVNVLALDTDMMLQANPYPLLRSPPMNRFQMVIVPEGSRVNLGFLYVRGADCAPAGGVASVLWDVVRRLRLFTEDWALLDRRGRRTSTFGLWDQGLFTDAISSSVRSSVVYPYTYLQSPKTPIWQALGWPTANMTVASLSKMHVVKWRDYRDRSVSPEWLKLQAMHYDAPTRAKRPAAFLPPIGHPQRAPWEQTRHPLLWVPLHVLDPLAHLRTTALSAVTPGWLEPAAKPEQGGAWPINGQAPGGLQAAGRGGTELMLATPDWLYCLVGRWAITAGWPSLAPRAVCAVLHLVECRSQFGNGWDASKATRPYVQRALGYWLLPEPQPSPLGAALEPPKALATGPRAIRLPRAEWEATGWPSGIGGLFNALQRLALYAAVTGRAPVIPSVPCSSKWVQRNQFGRSGIADDNVLQLPNRSAGGYHPDERDGGVECHLALGGKTCLLPTVLPAWTRASSGAIRFLGDAPPEEATARGLFADLEPPAGGEPRCRPSARRLTLQLASLRERAKRHEGAPMLEVASRLPARGAAAAHAKAWRCRAPDTIEASLTTEELARLGALRAACPGFFAERGSERGRLEWIHRRRTRNGVEL